MAFLQTKVAESRMTLPATAAYAAAAWVAAGLFGGGLWLQFACFAASVAVMAEMNNACALIRVYSMAVPSAYIALTCAATLPNPSVTNAGAGLFCALAVAVLLRCYQDRLSTGHTFYAFGSRGVARLCQGQMVYFVPLFWLLLAIPLRAMGWRTAMASVQGVCLPYWLMVPITMYTCGLEALADHLSQLAAAGRVCDFGTLSANQVATFAFTSALLATGAIHYHRQRIDDKIRTRMFYNCFAAIGFASAAFAVLQPQHFGIAIQTMAIGTSPLIGHFMALTKTRATNVAFCAIVAAAISLTIFNLWMPSTKFS